MRRIKVDMKEKAVEIITLVAGEGFVEECQVLLLGEGREVVAKAEGSVDYSLNR